MLQDSSYTSCALASQRLPIWNDNPVPVFDHYFSNACEACPPFIRIDGFLCDPQGFVSRTILHKYHRSFAIVQQRFMRDRSYTSDKFESEEPVQKEAQRACASCGRKEPAKTWQVT